MIPEAIKAVSEANVKLSETYSKVVAMFPVLETSAGEPLNLNLEFSIPDTSGSITDCNNRIA